MSERPPRRRPPPNGEDSPARAEAHEQARAAEPEDLDGPPSSWNLPDRWKAPADWDLEEAPAAPLSRPAPDPGSSPAGPESSAAPRPAPAPGPGPGYAPGPPAVPAPIARPTPTPPPTPHAAVATAVEPVPGGRHGGGHGRRVAAIAVLVAVLAAAAAITAYAVTRGDDPGAGVTASNAEVPILMYHLISAPPAGAAYPELYVRPAAFAGQMKYLHDQGFQAVTLRQVMQAWRGRTPLPEKPVVVSFDDGYPSHYQTAAPIMQVYGWKGLLNADWKVLSGSPRLLAQVKLLAQAGWEIGSHSLNHPDLTTLDAAALEQEVAGSRATLQEQFGVDVDTFCYPAGRYNDAVAAAVEKAGYWSATTTDPGLAVKTAPYRLKRIRINGSTSLQGFAEALRNAGV